MRFLRSGLHLLDVLFILMLAFEVAWCSHARRRRRAFKTLETCARRGALERQTGFPVSLWRPGKVFYCIGFLGEVVWSPAIYIYIYLNLENLHNRDSAVGKLFSHTAGSILPIATAWVMS